MSTSKGLAAAGWVCLLGSSLGDLTQWLVTPIGENDSARSQIAAAAAHPGRMSLSLWLDLPILLFIPAALFVGLVAGGRSSRLASIGATVVFAATLGAGYLLAIDPLVMAAARVPDRASATTVVAGYSGSPAIGAVTVLALAGEVIGFALLGIALIRRHAVPVWVGLAVLLSTPLEVGGEAIGGKAVAAVGDGVRVLAFLACAVALSRALRVHATGPAPSAAAALGDVGAGAEAGTRSERAPEQAASNAALS